MKLHYMIEYALRDRIREPRYEPVGVWVQGPGPGLDLVIEFLPGYRGMRGPVVETDEYPSVDACARMVIAKLR